MDPSIIPSVEEWFATSYADDTARVVHAVTRASGALLKIAGVRRQCWLRIGGVMQRTREQIEAEGRVADALAKGGVHVAQPIVRADGSFSATIHFGGGLGPAIAYEDVPGAQVVAPTREQAECLGDAIGRLRSRVVPDTTLPLVEPIAMAETCASAAAKWLTKEEERWLGRTVQRAVAALERVEPSGSETICHGDLRLGNVLFLDDVPTLVDLEAIGRGPRAYDLACMWRSRIVEADLADPPHDWEHLMRGYTRVVALREDERRSVPALAVLRAAWTMSLPALQGATWGGEWLRDPEYWRSHLRMVRRFAEVGDLAGTA